MTTHVGQITEDSLAALKVLMGRQVHLVYAPMLNVAGSHIAAPSFSVPVSDEIGGTWLHRFVNLEATWCETPRFLNDY